MNPISEELDGFLPIVTKVAEAAVAEPLSSARASLDGTGLLDLARDTADDSDALWWLTHVVRTAAESCPSLAFVLVARYAADCALAHGDAGRGGSAAANPTFALAVPGDRVTVAGALAPDAVVVLDALDRAPVIVPWADVASSAEVEPRSGLKAAELVTVTVPAGAELAAPSAGADMTAARWDLLTGAALAGVARRALRETRGYVLERRQFGVPIGSFAGLRAMVAEMELAVDGVEALLDRALEDALPSDAVLSAVAGRAAVRVCIDAIQAHGGYGYIEEYPLSGLLRDAISLQARAGGRRLHVARVAARGLGPRKG